MSKRNILKRVASKLIILLSMQVVLYYLTLFVDTKEREINETPNFDWTTFFIEGLVVFVIS